MVKIHSILIGLELIEKIMASMIIVILIVMVIIIIELVIY